MNETVRLASRLFASLLVAVLLAGCAHGGNAEQNDPYEKTNRAVFKFNMALDRNLMKPVAKGYKAALPEWTRSGIRCFFDNLATPVYLANDFLQGDLKAADTTFARFWENTLFGPAGFRDVARTQGKLQAQPEDFGQTLAVWGVKEGPYLMLPLLGPSNPRDLTGTVVDRWFDPTSYINWGDHNFWIPYATGALNVIDQRARTLEPLDELERTSVDFYASLRSLYRQSRENAIYNGELNVEELPNF